MAQMKPRFLQHTSRTKVSCLCPLAQCALACPLSKWIHWLEGVIQLALQGSSHPTQGIICFCTRQDPQCWCCSGTNCREVPVLSRMGPTWPPQMPQTANCRHCWQITGSTDQSALSNYFLNLLKLISLNFTMFLFLFLQTSLSTNKMLIILWAEFIKQ